MISLPTARLKASVIGATMLINAMATFAAEPVPVRFVEQPLTAKQAKNAQRA